MRISDWSSDVCSSDLVGQLRRVLELLFDPADVCRVGGRPCARAADDLHRHVEIGPGSFSVGLGSRLKPLHKGKPGRDRSEEHTSELQSLMRISYAVFCLKKKKQTKYQQQILDKIARLIDKQAQ